MAAALLSVILTLALTLAIHRKPEEPVEPYSTPAATPTPVSVLPIEVIDGEVWVAIPIERKESEE